MKKIFLALVFLTSIFLTACGTKSTYDIIEEELSVDVSSGKEISNTDSHGGFHGDGMTFIVLEFSDDTLAKELQQKSDWKQFPLDETMTTLVYGISDETSSVGPYVTDDNGNSLVPQIQNGYYILIDRQSQPHKPGNPEMMDRASFNFTFGIYDIDTNLLYYCEYDT